MISKSSVIDMECEIQITRAAHNSITHFMAKVLIDRCSKFDFDVIKHLNKIRDLNTFAFLPSAYHEISIDLRTDRVYRRKTKLGTKGKATCFYCSEVNYENESFDQGRLRKEKFNSSKVKLQSCVHYFEFFHFVYLNDERTHIITRKITQHFITKSYFVSDYWIYFSCSANMYVFWHCLFI